MGPLETDRSNLSIPSKRCLGRSSARTLSLFRDVTNASTSLAGENRVSNRPQPDHRIRRTRRRQPELADRRRRAARSCSRTSTCSRSSRASTASGSPSASCTRSARAPTATSRSRTPTSPRWTRMRMFERGGQAHAGLRRASRPSPARGARPTPCATRAASRSSSTPRTATGISSGNNTPIFFIRDGIKFPDFIHSQKHDPYTNEQEPDNVWDFFSHSPGGDAPVHLALRRPRHPGDAAPHGRLRLAHLPVGERRGRALLGEVPLQDRPGHPLPHERGGRARSAARTRSTTSTDLRTTRSSAASSRRGRSRCR